MVAKLELPPETPTDDRKPVIIRSPEGKFLPGTYATTGLTGPRVARHAKVRHYIEEVLGPNAQEAIDNIIGIARGEVLMPARAPAKGEDAASYALVPLIAPSIRERYDAWVWLAEMVGGKAKTQATVEVNDKSAKTVRYNPAKLTDAELAVAAEIARKSVESEEP